MVPVLIAVVGLALIVAAFLYMMGKIGSPGVKRSIAREQKLKEAERLLEKNPANPHALALLGDVYFEEELWDKAVKVYEPLSDMLVKGPIPKIDAFQVHFRYGFCAMKLSMSEHAYRGLSLARTLDKTSFEVNLNLGILEFERKDYEKALVLLQRARAQDPESPAVLRYMGHALFRMKKPKDAMTFIRKAIDLAPEDKESLYTLAECYHEANQTEQSLRVFSLLRTDPLMGPSACLFSGKIHSDTRQNETAIQDFEMGLRHENIKPDILSELRYSLAVTYIKTNVIDKALPLLRELQADNPSYKDVNILITRYQELNANKNLQTYLMASSADFVALCRKIVMGYFPKAKVKITDISVHKNDWADILAEIDSYKWQEVIMFRFMRAQGSIGELVVRDFHSLVKEVKASKGICITVGNFSEEAKRYTEARLIELMEKDKFLTVLNRVDIKPVAAMARPQKK